MPASCLPAVPGTADNELSAKYTPGPLEDQISDYSIFTRMNVNYCTQRDKFYKLGEIWTDTEVKVANLFRIKLVIFFYNIYSSIVTYQRSQVPPSKYPCNVCYLDDINKKVNFITFFFISL